MAKIIAITPGAHSGSAPATYLLEVSHLELASITSEAHPSARAVGAKVDLQALADLAQGMRWKKDEIRRLGANVADFGNFLRASADVIELLTLPPAQPEGAA